MDINPHATVFARKEIMIHASVKEIWQNQVDIEHWPDWQPDITTVKLDGELKAGTTFRWKAQGLNITSRLLTVETNQRTPLFRIDTHRYSL
jgi:hypothetical protein